MKSIFLLILVLITACGKKAPEQAMLQPVAPVRVTQASCRDVPEHLAVTGELKASSVIDIHAQVEGKVVKVYVQEGQWVKKNASLFLIDPVPYRLKVEEAQAELAKHKAALQESIKTLERFQGLAKKELISKREWDELKAKVAQGKSECALCQAKLKSAKLDLSRCQIKAPIDGRLGKLDVHPGQKVLDVPLAQVSTLDPLLCEYKLTEKQFQRLSKDTVELEIQPLSLANVKLKAKTTFVDNHFDPKSGQILLRAKVVNSGYQVRPGQIVRVMIPIVLNKEATVIVQRAVKHNHQGPYVYVIQEDQTVVERAIKLGVEIGDEVMVLEGLSTSELVVVEGHQRLFSGAKVEIKS